MALPLDAYPVPSTADQWAIARAGLAHLAEMAERRRPVRHAERIVRDAEDYGVPGDQQRRVG